MKTKPSKKIQGRSTGLSACCKAEMTVVGFESDEGTMYYKCTYCSKPCDMWSSTPQETTKQMEDWEKEAVGKNVHSVYTHCLSCSTWGVNMPLDKICGNCGKSTDTYTYYDSETISLLLSSQKLDLKKKIEEWISKEDSESCVDKKDFIEFLKTL